jgi:hypothetical protein
LCVPRHKDPGVELFGSHDHYEITVCWRSSSERLIEYRRQRNAVASAEYVKEGNKG